MPPASPLHFAGLNGLRALAALAVVVSHTTLALGEFNLDPYLFGASQDGKPAGISLAGFGVSIFFALSGFLITYLLQEERQRQPISIPKFYWRRILRIWPLYYAYLLVALLVMAVNDMPVDSQALVLYIFYAANVPFILGAPIDFLAHYWSLGVEEQFYLVWPWVNRRWQKPATIILVLIVLLIGCKLLLHVLIPGSLWEQIIHVTRFHCMLIGALGALWYRAGNRWLMAVADNKLTQAVCWLVIGLAAINRFHIASVIDNEIIAFVALLLILGQIGVRNRVINLERPLFDALGRISYGIYVIHPLAIFLLGKGLRDVALDATLKYPLVYALVLSATIGTAWFSYHYFESYFLGLKRRYEVVPSEAGIRS
ncbi:MAG: acyltransferase [Cyclobacteriaceae bacterium]|nr:acyltransferase [Cyclobacteriaceae bacterium]